MVADMISACKDPNEIRVKFEIKNDFTPEEEEKDRRKNQWTFQWAYNNPNKIFSSDIYRFLLILYILKHKSVDQ